MTPEAKKALVIPADKVNCKAREGSLGWAGIHNEVTTAPRNISVIHLVRGSDEKAAFNVARTSKLASKGFTIIEMVAVIVLLGVIGTASLSFIGSSVKIYGDSARRDNLMQLGRFAVERVSRELRNALPGSVRVSGDKRCIEFIPIKAVSKYLARVSDKAVPDITIVAMDTVDYTYASGDKVAIYTITDDEVYNTPVEHLAAVASVDDGNTDEQVITLSAANQFPSESPYQRLYIVNEQVSFCASDNQLMRYQGYPVSTGTQPAPPGSDYGVLLAENIRVDDGGTVDVFTYTAGTLQRAGIVHLDFRFRDSVETDEWVKFSHDVSIRNVP